MFDALAYTSQVYLRLLAFRNDIILIGYHYILCLHDRCIAYIMFKMHVIKQFNTFSGRICYYYIN